MPELGHFVYLHQHAYPASRQNSALRGSFLFLCEMVVEGQYLNHFDKNDLKL
jgi:hypothetical protein